MHAPRGALLGLTRLIQVFSASNWDRPDPVSGRLASEPCYGFQTDGAGHRARLRLLGGALLFLDGRTRHGRWGSQYLALAVFVFRTGFEANLRRLQSVRYHSYIP